MAQEPALKPLIFQASLFIPQFGLKFASIPSAGTCCRENGEARFIGGVPWTWPPAWGSFLPHSGWELPKEVQHLQQTNPAWELYCDLGNCQQAPESLITYFIYRFPSFSQYPNLWSVSNSTITPVSQSSGMSNGLSSQFLRGSPAHYSALPHPVSAASSASPLYDSGTPTDLPDSQYDASAHARLASTWTPVTPPSM